MNKQRSLQNELIFRLLLKITVERLHECFYFILFAREGSLQYYINIIKSKEFVCFLEEQH